MIYRKGFAYGETFFICLNYCSINVEPPMEIGGP